MEISEKVKSKIIDYAVDMNAKNIHNQLPKSGRHTLEFDFKLGLNDKTDKYAFVVYEKYSYYNGSLKERKYQILAFDINTGDLIPDFEKSGGCYYGFFNDLKIVQDIV
jgi:hypothetical protein